MDDYTKGAVRADDPPASTDILIPPPIPLSPIRTSPTVGKLMTALAKAQAEFPIIKKSQDATVKGTSKATGNEYDRSYKYADLADVLTAALPITGKHGIALIQPPILESGHMTLVTRLACGEEWMESDYPVCSLNVGKHQDMGGALTYSRRYAALTMLGLAPAEDDDAASAPSPQDAKATRGKGKGKSDPAVPDWEPERGPPQEEKQADYVSDGGYVEPRESKPKDKTPAPDRPAQKAGSISDRASPSARKTPPADPEMTMALTEEDRKKLEEKAAAERSPFDPTPEEVAQYEAKFGTQLPMLDTVAALESYWETESRARQFYGITRESPVYSRLTFLCAERKREIQNPGGQGNGRR